MHARMERLLALRAQCLRERALPGLLLQEISGPRRGRRTHYVGRLCGRMGLQSGQRAMERREVEAACAARGGPGGRGPRGEEACRILVGPGRRAVLRPERLRRA